jgi:hypothetical protein
MLKTISEVKETGWNALVERLGVAGATLFNQDYNEALTFAEYDIKSNWRVYKKAFLGGKEYEHPTE